MTEFDPVPESVEPLAVVPVRRAYPFVAWVVIVACIVLIVGLPHLLPSRQEAVAIKTASLLEQVEGRYLVGAANLLPVGKQSLYQQAGSFNTGPVGDRLRFVTIAGELAGPGEASAQLQRLQDKLVEENHVLDSDERALMDILGRLYQDYSADQWNHPSIDEKEGQQLQSDLGWFGNLALAPAESPDTARRDAVLHSAFQTAIVIWSAAGWFFLLGVAGFVGVVTLLILALNRRLRDGIAYPSPWGGIYAETFALWMVLFIVLSMVVGLVPGSNFRLLYSGAASLLSLSALAWPVLRGVPWNQVREDLGLVAGRWPGVEPALGLLHYSMAVPFVVGGVIGMVVLMALQQLIHHGGPPADNFAPRTDLPSHPIVPFVAGGNPWAMVQVFLVATVVAPFVEEIMFRGVLYRHLREASRLWGAAMSMLFSGLVGAFVFAVIHPQGLVTVPALMAVAGALTLAREWRGTLIPGMIAHGLWNGTLLLIATFAFGS